MKQPSPTPDEVEKVMEKFLAQLQTESLENYSKIRSRFIDRLYSATPDDNTVYDDDYVYEDYNTDAPSPIDEEPEYDSDEEIYLKSCPRAQQQQN
jgi:hypothetical protein